MNLRTLFLGTFVRISESVLKTNKRNFIKFTPVREQENLRNKFLYVSSLSEIYKTRWSHQDTSEKVQGDTFKIYTSMFTEIIVQSHNIHISCTYHKLHCC